VKVDTYVVFLLYIQRPSLIVDSVLNNTEKLTKLLKGQLKNRATRRKFLILSKLEEKNLSACSANTRYELRIRMCGLF
jgi:hypothetical protein